MSSDVARPRVIRALAALALAAFVGYSSLAIASHVLKPEFDPVHQPLSEYALGPWGFVMSAAIGLRGIGGLLFAALLSKRLPPSPQARRVVFLMALWGLCCLLSALFPTDLLGEPATSAGRIHRVSAPSSWLILCLAVIQLTCWTPGKEVVENRFIRAMAFATLATFLALLAVILVYGRGAYFGLAQRAFHVAFMAWLIGVAAIRDGPFEDRR